MVIIQPFTYQMSTAFKERVNLADKLNEVIDLLNAWGDVPEQFEQVQEQIQTIGQQINDITTKISTIETNLGQLQTTVTNLGAKLNRAAVASTLSTTDHIDSEKVGIAIGSIDGTTNKVSYLVGATAENAGLMTAADKEKLDDAITEFPIASTTQLGAIKVGANLQISKDGTLNATGGGGGEVSLPAHIVGANDANALVSVSPVRQDGNLFIRTTYKDYTTAGTTAKNVDGGPFPIASAEDSGLMAATDKQTLNDVKDTTDAMSTRVDTIQSDLDTLEQNFQDLKGDLLTSPAEVVQVADESHDGIITKEIYQKIQTPPSINAEDFGILSVTLGTVQVTVNKTLPSPSLGVTESNWPKGTDFTYDDSPYFISPINDKLILGKLKNKLTPTGNYVMKGRTNSDIPGGVISITLPNPFYFISPRESSDSNISPPSVIFNVNDHTYVIDLAFDSGYEEVERIKIGDHYIFVWKITGLYNPINNFLFSLEKGAPSIPSGTVANGIIVNNGSLSGIGVSSYEVKAAPTTIFF